METLFLLKATACAASIFLAVGLFYFVDEVLPSLLAELLDEEE